MLSHQLLFLCSVMFLAHMLLAFPTGAPTGGACGTRTPKHGNNTASEGTSSYIIVVDRAICKSLRIREIISGQATSSTVQVKLMSISRPTQFKGFLMQALDINESPIGFFSVPEGSPAQVTDCPSNQTMASVTHISNNDKSSVDAVWTPPLDYQGPVTFVATVVQNFTTFFLNIKSPVVAVISGQD